MLLYGKMFSLIFAHAQFTRPVILYGKIADHGNQALNRLKLVTMPYYKIKSM